MKRLLGSITLVLVILLAACGGGLDRPEPRLEADRLVSWDAIDNATAYEIETGEETITVTEPSWTIPGRLFGELSIRVRATDGDRFGDFSEPLDLTVYLQLAPPDGIRQENGAIRWNAVAEATGYVVRINGVEYPASGTTFTYQVLAPTTVEILALGNPTGYVRNSLFSDSVTLRAQLASVANITFDDGVLSWDAVANATSYRIVIDGDTYTATTNELILPALYGGDVDVSVTALDNTSTYLSSIATTTAISIPMVELDTPTGVTVASGILSFNAVTGATRYDIYVDGMFYSTITTTTYTLPTALLNDGALYVQVVADADGFVASQPSTRAYIEVTAIATESALRAIDPDGAYVLTADIELSGSWVPMSFTGFFDGDGHTISGIVITADEAEIGFFTNLSEAVVQNLRLEGSIDLTTTSNNARVGGLAGRSTKSDIENVDVDMSILAVSTNGVGFLGGLFGQSEGNRVVRSSFTGTIEATHFTVGGLIGLSDDPTAEQWIYQSAVTATITVVGGEQSASGGFIGRMGNNRMTIEQSVADVVLSGPGYVGGFVGYLGSGRIEDSLALGTVEATSAFLVHAGGFIGRMEGYNSHVATSISKVAVTASETGDDIFVGSFVGHTVGGTYHTVYDNCVYDMATSSLDRIGNPDSGRGDGIRGEPMNTPTTLEGFDTSVWNFTASTPALNWQSQQ